MSVALGDRIGVRRRALVIAIVLALLALAGVANATIKQHRAEAGNGPSSALSDAETSGAATSSAWYCAGPLPIGLHSERARIVVGNVSRKTVRGELVVAGESGVAPAVPLVVAGGASLAVPLAAGGHIGFVAATVLLDGAGVGVEELVSGPTGSDAAPCVSHATSTQYLAGGATNGSSAIDLAIFDPGATPSVASVTFSTSTGRVAPPAFQQMPVEAGETLVLDVARYLPLQGLLATTVVVGGGRVVVGAIASRDAGKVNYPAIISATAVPEPTWYFGPDPSGPEARQGFVVLNPAAVAAHVAVDFVGTSSVAVLDAVVPAGAVVELAPTADVSPSALRWASVTATAPVVVTRETLIGGAAAAGSTGGGKGTTSSSAASVSSFPGPVPQGFALTAGSFVLDRSWLVEGGESNARNGELLLIANPSSTPAVVSFAVLAGGSAPAALTVRAGSSVVVNLDRMSGGPGGVALEIESSVPLLVGGGSYARGSSGLLGFNAPAAIPVD